MIAIPVTFALDVLFGSLLSLIVFPAMITFTVNTITQLVNLIPGFGEMPTV